MDYQEEICTAFVGTLGDVPCDAVHPIYRYRCTSSCAHYYRAHENALYWDRNGNPVVPDGQHFVSW